MALANFIPDVWSARILQALETSHVYGQAGVVNRDYEGEIKNEGDSVKINSVGDPTILSYTRNADIATPEELTSAQRELLIDQAKYFNFAVDDVDAVQMNVSVMDTAMKRAAYGLKNVVDTFLASTMNTAAVAGNTIGSIAVPDTFGAVTEAYDRLVDLAVILDENDTPEDQRWVAIPAWYQGLLLKDARFVGSGAQSADARLMNGQVGNVSGLRLLLSNQTPRSGTDYIVLAGHAMATSYAEQIVKVEAFRPERRFSDAVKGLHVYGAKVVRPLNLARLYITRPTGL